MVNRSLESCNCLHACCSPKTCGWQRLRHATSATTANRPSCVAAGAPAARLRPVGRRLAAPLMRHCTAAEPTLELLHEDKRNGTVDLWARLV
nr:unnamed protein product [Digitaria exilis]